MLHPTLSNLGANAEIDALTALLDSGTFEIYGGSQPVSADDPVTTQPLLATLTFSSPAFQSGVAGRAEANAIISDPDATGGDDATWYRLKTLGGAAVCDGTVGTVGANLNLNSVTIPPHIEFSISNWALTARKS